MQIPAVEVSDLRPFDHYDPTELSSQNGPGLAGADWDNELLN
jgi:hypothetical protein